METGDARARREALTRRAAALIERLADGGRDEAARDALLLDLLRFQVDAVPAYGRLLSARGVRAEEAVAPQALPALPTDIFRHVRIASHPEAEDVRRFETSGTTGALRGVHPLSDLSLYDRAARAAARHALFPEPERTRLVVLAPHEQEAPASSLSYMLSRFAEWFGDGDARWVMPGGTLDLDALAGALSEAEHGGVPVALLGTSFAFVHAEEGLSRRGADASFRLPEGSRIMQTGGYKGRSREIAPAEMRRLLSTRYGVPEGRVVAEYGMTELSSQMYETTLLAPGEPRRLWVPGWVRAVPVHPESLAPVAPGEVGILRIDDVANVGSVCAVQTADLARVEGQGVVVLGRAPGTTPRGCSLAVDAILEGAEP